MVDGLEPSGVAAVMARVEATALAATEPVVVLDFVAAVRDAVEPMALAARLDGVVPNAVAR